jgi:hypothetical protein
LTLVVRTGVILLGARRLSASATVAAFSVAGAVLNLGLIAWVTALVWREAKRGEDNRAAGTP